MNALESFIASKPMGFITQADLPELIKLDRLCPLLVRIGGGRFTCAAQDLEHLIACVIAGGDYVRDVSFPVGSIERVGKWQPEPSNIGRSVISGAYGLGEVIAESKSDLTLRLSKSKTEVSVNKAGNLHYLNNRPGGSRK